MAKALRSRGNATTACAFLASFHAQTLPPLTCRPLAAPSGVALLVRCEASLAAPERLHLCARLGWCDELAVAAHLARTRDRRGLTGALLAWLRVEFAVETPGQRLEAFGALDEGAFIEEVRRHRPRSAGRLSPAALADLRATFAAESTRMRANQREAGQLEHRLANLVNGAYGLTPAEIALLCRTAPPRMPIASARGVVDKERV